MGLTNIEWVDDTQDPLDQMTPHQRRAVFAREEQLRRNPKWSWQKNLVWVTALFLSFCWGAMVVPFLVLACFIPVLGWAFVLPLWVIASMPAVALINMKIKSNIA